MKRTAFTVVELMVVVVMIALLLAMLLPSFNNAFSLARATVCRGNLRHISTGFATHATRQRQAGGQAAGYYPPAESFPSIPLDVLLSPETFLCPEAEAHQAVLVVSDPLEGLLYACRNRGFEIPFNDPGHQGLGKMNLGTREGKDERGEYIEVGLDDNAPVTAAYMDRDGHDGIIRIYINAGGKMIAKLMKYSCGERNCVTYQGEPLFVSPQDPPGVTTPGSEQYGWLGPGASKNGMEVELKLGGRSSWCTYGMTLGADQFQALSHKILVLDYDTTVVDPLSWDVQPMLQAAARHLGRLNVLFADDSVRPYGPTEIDPLLPSNAHLWEP
ncbi:MAG: hypothetical protein WBF17_08630 [Phycisphaerae bacterium]